MPSRRASATASITGRSWAAATAMIPGSPPRAASMMPSMVLIILLSSLYSSIKNASVPCDILTILYSAAPDPSMQKRRMVQ